MKLKLPVRTWTLLNHFFLILSMFLTLINYLADDDINDQYEDDDNEEDAQNKTASKSDSGVGTIIQSGMHNGRFCKFLTKHCSHVKIRKCYTVTVNHWFIIKIIISLLRLPKQFFRIWQINALILPSKSLFSGHFLPCNHDIHYTLV